jgi:SHR-binding domain of vacuolar-sorting associated protein 13
MIFNLSDLYEKSVLKNYIKLEKKQETKFNYIKLEINHPLFEFFCSYGLQGSCVIDLGKVSLYQELKHVDLSVTGSNIYTLVTHNEELYKEVVLYDFEISLDADMHIVNVRIPSISLASSLAQVKFIKKLWNEYSANFVQLQHVFNKPHTVSGPVQEKKEISEQLAHGCTYYQETLKLNLSLGKLMLIWTTNFTNNAENRDSVRLEACLNNIQSDCIQVQDTLSVKCKIQSITLQFNLIETLYVLFPHSGNLFVANLQINPSKNVIDVNFNCPRVIITPKTVQVLMILKEEFNSLIVPSPSNNSSNVISGEIKNLQVIITNDGTITIDEEFVEAAIEHEQKRFYMIQFSNVFQEFSCKFQEFFIVTGKTSKFVDDITGKYILHPVDFLVTYENCFKVVISEVNIDFSLSQVPYFTEVYQQFSLIQSQPSENIKYTQFEMELEVQQLLISISHDFSISRNSTNTYFIFQLDFPSIIKSGTVNFTTTLEIFYYNQQYFDWEPFLEKSEVSVTYSQQGKLKRIELKSSDQINFNISSGLISTFSNFWRGIQQHNILENISLMSPNLINRINSGFAIRNETGQKLKYWIDGRVHSLSNWEEESLDFEEVEEEQAAPVIMFKNNQKTRKAYRIKTISVKIGDQGKINDICIDKLGCKLYNIAQQGSHYQVICEVSSRHGDNVLTIRSPIQLKNLLREPIDIRLIFPLAQNKLNEEDYSSTINVPPLSTVPLPIGSSYFTEFQLRIRGYGWSSRKGINNPDPIVIECPHKPINSYDLQSSRKRENSDDIKIAFAVFKQSQVELKDDTEKFSVKLYSFESPFIIENCLCCDLEYQCVSYQTSNKAHGLLRRGESFNWLEITPHAKILLSLRITGYDWTPFLEVLEESKQIYQFSKKYSEQVNVLLEASKKEGMFKLVFFAQYWLENHTGLPLLFKYMENELNYDIISLPYVIEGVYIEERNEKKKGQLNSMFAAFGEKLDIDEEEDIKPWMRYKTDKKIGLGSLLNDEEVSDEGQGTIRMFSSDISNPIKGFVSIKLANSSWSKVFRLVGNEGKKDLLTVSGHSIQAFEESKSRRSCIYEVAMTMQIAEDPFSRTKIIRFTSRFVMINKMPSVLLISQHEPNLDLSGVCRLIPNERSAYHWTDQLKSRSICVRPESYGWQWSGHFYIEGPDDFVMRIRNIHTHEEILIHITITLEDSTLHIIYQDISHMPPYRIENLSMETLLISQINSKVSDKILKPFEVCGYAWDEPTLKKILKVSLHMQGNNSSIHIRDFKIDSQKDLEKINLKPHGSHPSHPLYVEVTNSGSTKVLVFRHELKEEDDVKQNREFNSDDLSVIINFGYIGISIINSSPEEIIYASFLDVKFQLDKSYSEVSGDFRITSGQIDNQLYRAINPVMLSMLENNADLINISFNKRQTTVFLT